MTDEWKEIPGAPGYDASAGGLIRSRRAAPRILKQSISQDGYPRVTIPVDGKLQTINVATLVCRAFHGQRPDGMQVAHGDGVRTNSSAANLSWKSPKGNMEDRLHHGRAPRGERCGTAKLTDAQAGEIRKRYVRGRGRWYRGNCRELADEYGVEMDTIWSIATGKTRSY